MRPDNTPYRNPADDLAALVDGEITDVQRISELNELLGRDPELKAELDAQREVKLLLSGLPEAEAPAFMQTRIMGEISARRNMKRGRVWLPNWGAAAAAVALFGLGYGIAVQSGSVATLAPQFAVAPTGGVTAAPPIDAYTGTTTPDISPAFSSGQAQSLAVADQQYETLATDSSSVDLPANASPWLQEFIKVSSDAHNYSRTMRLTHNLVSPDVSQAVMVVDSH